MNSILSKLFRWQPSYETLIPAVTGLIVVSLSVALITVQELPWLGIVIRDIIQVFLVGILFPLVYVQRSGNRFTYSFTLFELFQICP